MTFAFTYTFLALLVAIAVDLINKVFLFPLFGDEFFFNFLD